MHKVTFIILCSLACPGVAGAESTEEVVSFKCGLAIDAAIAAMDRQANNQVTQQALSEIDENNGEFVCIHSDDEKIHVRLQSREMTPTDNRLLFTIDSNSYRVLKTYYGR